MSRASRLAAILLASACLMPRAARAECERTVDRAAVRACHGRWDGVIRRTRDREIPVLEHSRRTIEGEQAECHRLERRVDEALTAARVAVAEVEAEVRTDREHLGYYR